MDNEKYGIELELITSKFNEKMEKVKSSFSSLTDKKVNLTANTAQLEYLKQQIKEISALLDYNAKKPFMNYNDVLKNRVQLEKLTNQYNKLLGKQKEVTVASGTMHVNMSKGFDRMNSKIKRFGLSLLGIRTIWSLVSRASSAYMAQDTALANKMQSVWAGLGAILAPIIEGIVNILAKGVKYINIFIKALTGVDLLAKASAKSIAGTTKSAKALNKALAGFDELQNIDTDASGGGADLGAGLGGLEDVEVDTAWAERIQAFGEWVKTSWMPVIGILTAGVGLLIGSVPVAITGAIVFVLGMITKYWEQIKAFFQSGIDWLVSKTDWVRENFGIIGEMIYKTFTDLLQSVLDIFDSIFRAIRGIFDGFITFIKGVFTGNWKQAWEGIKQIFTSIWEGIKGVFTAVFNFIKKMVVNVATTTGNIIAGAFRAVVNAVMFSIENILNAPIRAINGLISVINAVPGINLGKLNTFSLPRLDTGTNYVPQDQLAMIHKGEAVVPKKFNSKEYFGGGNDETNARLEELIEAVRNIEINPYTTIRDVGKASLNYINSKSRQLGESVVV